MIYYINYHFLNVYLIFIPSFLKGIFVNVNLFNNVVTNLVKN